MLAQAKGLPAEFEEHFFDVPLAVRVELDQQFLGEAMIVLSRDDRVTLLDFTDISDSRIAASERDTWADYLKQGVALGACEANARSRCWRCTTTLKIHCCRSSPKMPSATTEAQRYYELPEGGSTGLIVRNQLNLNGGQDQDLGGRYGLEASSSLGNWTPDGEHATGATGRPG